ncbi:MAG: MarR family transcriptional regulator [Rhizobiales bacterium]|nr:MarR family transcriptional regulator [Hyphomicrobiales bacterium]
MRIWLRLLRLDAGIGVGVGHRLRGLGLSIPQFDVLSTLTEQDGITQQQLAARLYVTKGNVSGLVNRLAENGLVKRSPIAGDRRSYALSLTAKGRAMAQAGIRTHEAYVRETLGRMPKGERELFNALLVKLRDAVREAEASGAAGATA